MNSNDPIFRDLFLGISVIVIMVVLPIVLALHLEGRHRSRRPKCHPYGWGYYLGLNGLLAPIFWGLTSGNVAGSFLAGAIIYYPFAILTLRRNRWGLLILTFLSINPVIWVVNGFYISKRWSEMATKKPLLPPSPPQSPPPKYFLHLDDQVKGPFSKEQIRALLSVGTITPDTQCCEEGSNQWDTLFASGALRDSRLSTEQPKEPTGTKNKDRTFLLYLVVILIAPLGVMLSLLAPALVRSTGQPKAPAFEAPASDILPRIYNQEVIARIPPGTPYLDSHGGYHVKPDGGAFFAPATDLLVITTQADYDTLPLDNPYKTSDGKFCVKGLNTSAGWQ